MDRLLMLAAALAACGKSTPKKAADVPTCDQLVPAAVHDQFLKTAVLKPVEKHTLERISCIFQDTASRPSSKLIYIVSADCDHADAAAVTAHLAEERNAADGVPIDGLGDGAFATADKGFVEGHLGAGPCLLGIANDSTVKIDSTALAKAIFAGY